MVIFCTCSICFPMNISSHPHYEQTVALMQLPSMDSHLHVWDWHSASGN